MPSISTPLRLRDFLIFLVLTSLLTTFNYLQNHPISPPPFPSTYTNPNLNSPLSLDPRAHMDLVYMWLDGSDPAWQKMYGADDVSSRSRNNDELYYSILSWTKYAKWHTGRIVIVTPGQTPNWLQTTTPLHIRNEIVIVDQRDLLPGRSLTRNNFVIEAHLHHIPNITANFIYVNDDYFWGSDVSIDKYISVDSKPTFFRTKNLIVYDTKNLPSNADSNSNSDKDKAKKEKANKNKNKWLSATLSTAQTIHALYPNVRMYFMEHAPYVFNTAVLAEANSLNLAKLNEMKTLTGRTPFDLIFVLFYQYHYIATHTYAYGSSMSMSLGMRLSLSLSKGYNQVHDKDIYFAKITNNKVKNEGIYKRIRMDKPYFFTLNDEYTSKRRDVGDGFNSFLKDYFSDVNGGGGGGGEFDNEVFRRKQKVDVDVEMREEVDRKRIWENKNNAAVGRKREGGDGFEMRMRGIGKKQKNNKLKWA